jgi:hypothetical protein
MLDLAIRDEGTVVGIEPRSEAGRTWVDENMVFDPWQVLGGAIWVEHRFAPAIISAARCEGLEVR